MSRDKHAAEVRRRPPGKGMLEIAIGAGAQSS